MRSILIKSAIVCMSVAAALAAGLREHRQPPESGLYLRLAIEELRGALDASYARLHAGETISMPGLDLVTDGTWQVVMASKQYKRQYWHYLADADKDAVNMMERSIQLHHGTYPEARAEVFAK